MLVGRLCLEIGCRVTPNVEEARAGLTAVNSRPSPCPDDFLLESSLVFKKGQYCSSS